MALHRVLMMGLIGEHAREKAVDSGGHRLVQVRLFRQLKFAFPVWGVVEGRGVAGAGWIELRGGVKGLSLTVLFGCCGGA